MGVSGPSLLIESTNSYIYIYIYIFFFLYESTQNDNIMLIAKNTKFVIASNTRLGHNVQLLFGTKNYFRKCVQFHVTGIIIVIVCLAKKMCKEGTYKN